MRRLDGINMSFLSNLQETVDKEAWCAAAHGLQSWDMTLTEY